MQPKNLETYWDQKIHQNKGTQEITQPLRKKNITQNHATSWDKNHATSQDKKKSRDLSGQKKNNRTSRDKKKSRNLWGQKKSCNLSRQKSHALNCV